MDNLPRPGFRLILKKAEGGAEIAFENWAERSSPRNESGTNCRGSVGNLGGDCQTLRSHSLFLTGGARSVLVDYREGLSIQSAGYKLCGL